MVFSSLIGYEVENYEYIGSNQKHYYKGKFEKDSVEEIKLFEAFRNNNDKKARETIIMNNTRLVQHLAAKYSKKFNLDINELESYGYEYLCKAVDKFDYTKGLNFSSYAYKVIKAGMKNGIAEICNKSSCKSLRKYYYKVNKYITRVEQEENKKITDDISLIDKVVELMVKEGELGANYKAYAKNYICSHIVLSLDTDNINIQLDGGYGNITDDIYNMQLKEYVKKTLSEVLNEREKKLIEKRFGLNGEVPTTLEEIGKEMSITRERIRQIEKRALEKLKYKLSLFVKDTCDSTDYLELYDYVDEEDYFDNNFDDDYDYKKPPRR